MKQAMTGRQNSGMALSEIMVAVFILALAFIPIIGVMGSSIRATGKEDSVNRAMNLCQEKLNTSLQFPFDFFTPHLNKDIDIAINSPGVTMELGEETIQGIKYTSILRVSDRPGTFNVPVRDLTLGNPDKPETWQFSNVAVPYSNLVYSHTLTVTWLNKGEKTPKSYALVTFRAKLRND
jgi:hypothetical protein